MRKSIDARRKSTHDDDLDTQIKNIDKQIEQINALENDYEQVQFLANNLIGLVPDTLDELNKIETKLVEARSKYTEKSTLYHIYNRLIDSIIHRHGTCIQMSSVPMSHMCVSVWVYEIPLYFIYG